MPSLRRYLIALFAAVLVTGCASNVPKPIRTELPGAPGVAEVRDNTAAYQGQPVRWGGIILSIDNRERTSVVEVLARPLDGRGRPEKDAVSPGRFLARLDGFLDPAQYEAQRELTVTGTVVGSETRSIGDFDYAYPVVEVDVFYLWPPPIEREPYPYYDPFWYDPWYPYPWYPYYRPYPYYPYGPYPYR